MWEDSSEESAKGAVETSDEYYGKNNCASNSYWPDGMLLKYKIFTPIFFTFFFFSVSEFQGGFFFNVFYYDYILTHLFYNYPILSIPSFLRLL